ncbi:zinc finger Y-chromosomal protein 2-like [Cimex lectularius]|uniref:C2H2-type domain-containing protein n=1 Tax=Cimex lectularius TaxID=79782 RepID=A0A8I6SGD6_CIMLE|nr:zinc finger Y-chromosomal protein 2-like [Cimex lectularius]
MNLLECSDPSMERYARHFCPNCDRSYKHKFTLNAHLRYECGKEPQFMCRFCPYKCRFICPKCGRGYKHKHHMNSHLKYECNTAPQFECKFCNKMFKQKVNMKSHIALKHSNWTGPNPLKVTVRKMRQVLQEQVELVGTPDARPQDTKFNERHVCLKCGRTYKHKRNLNTHVRNECGQEPKFFCTLCPFKSKQKSNLKSHIAIMHRMEFDNTEDWGEVEVLQPTNFSKHTQLKLIAYWFEISGNHCCKKCGRKYKHRCNLITHLRVECGKEPKMLCQYCPYKTKHKSSLKTHIALKHSKILV